MISGGVGDSDIRFLSRRSLIASETKSEFSNADLLFLNTAGEGVLMKGTL